MLRIWISRSSSIPIREQLSAQLLFGIVTHRMPAGERLPSVRELARRIKVHPNTISAAYQDLVRRGWIKRRAGSGVFVRDFQQEGRSVEGFIENGLAAGFTIAEMKAALEAIERRADPRPWLVVHPDVELARILAAELSEVIGFPLASASMDAELNQHRLLTTASVLESISGHRPEVIPLKSVEEVIARIPQPSSPAMMAIVSRSQSILKWASLLTPTLGLVGSELIQRNPADRGWREGLKTCDLIATDMLAVRELRGSTQRVAVLRLVSDVFLRGARELVTGKKE